MGQCGRRGLDKWTWENGCASLGDLESYLVCGLNVKVKKWKEDWPAFQTNQLRECGQSCQLSEPQGFFNLESSLSYDCIYLCPTC